MFPIFSLDFPILKVGIARSKVILVLLVVHFCLQDHDLSFVGLPLSGPLSSIAHMHATTVPALPKDE